MKTLSKKQSSLFGMFETFEIEGIMDEERIQEYSQNFNNVMAWISDLGHNVDILDLERGIVRAIYYPPWIKRESELLKSILEDELGVELRFTYAFMTEYGPDSWMSPHCDRAACDVSVSVCVLQPKIWPLKYRVKSPRYDQDSIDLQSELLPGEGLVYPGCDVLHWREPNVNEYSQQIFFHYTRIGGQRDVEHQNVLKVNDLLRRTTNWIEEDPWSRGIVSNHLYDWRTKKLIPEDESKEYLEKYYD